MQHIRDLTEEQQQQIATCLLFLDHQITAIMGGTSEIVVLIHPQHEKGQKCLGFAVTGNVGAEGAKELMIKGIAHLDHVIEVEKLSATATHPTPSTSQ